MAIEFEGKEQRIPLKKFPVKNKMQDQAIRFQEIVNFHLKCLRSLTKDSVEAATRVQKESEQLEKILGEE